MHPNSYPYFITTINTGTDILFLKYKPPCSYSKYRLITPKIMYDTNKQPSIIFTVILHTNDLFHYNNTRNIGSNYVVKVKSTCH